MSANLEACLGPGARTDWCSPVEVLERVYRVGPVALDPSSSAESILEARHVRLGPWCVWGVEAADGFADGVGVYGPADVQGCVQRTDEGWVGGPSDGLALDWADPALGEGLVYCNPPYGRGIDAWVAKARATAAAGRDAIALVPARVDTRWWRESCAPPKADAVCFWGGRLTFLDAGDHRDLGAELQRIGVRDGGRSDREEEGGAFCEAFRDAGDLWLPS